MQPMTPAPDASPAHTDGPPELETSLVWPPRIMWTQVPLPTRVRDVLLTILAWLAYVVILRKPIVNIIAWASPSLGASLKEVIGIDYAVDTVPYLWIASGLVLVLVLSGVRRRADLRRVPNASQDVPSLSPGAQFDAAGVPLAQRGSWRDARCLHVRHDRDGQIESASAVPSAADVAPN